MLDPAAFAQAVAQCHPHAVSLDQLLYRAVALRHFMHFPTSDPLYAATGSRSRYVGPKLQAALYAAFDPETAFRELNQDFYGRAASSPGLIPSGALRPLPGVVMGVYVRVQRVLDLTGAAARAEFGVANDADLLQPWKLASASTATQLLGDAVYTDGFFEGILYPSAQHSDHTCLVLFPDRFQTGAAVVHFRSLTPGLKDARLP